MISLRVSEPFASDEEENYHEGRRRHQYDPTAPESGPPALHRDQSQGPLGRGAGGNLATDDLQIPEVTLTDRN
jgi:hypothetical protein